jgi:type IV pilus assembly protein PilC
MEFRCRVATAAGEVVESVYVADSEVHLRHDLEEKGFYLLSMQRKGSLPFGGLSLPTRRRVPTREFLVFNQELATLLKAGMPLVQSLNLLRQRISNPVFKAVMDDVHERVRSGTALSDAFAAHGDLFPGVYTASLFAGEKSGGLEQVLRRYVTYVKVIGEVRRKTISALVYPAILTVLSFAVVALIMVKVVPAFGSFYASFDRELPLSTRIIVGISETVTGYVWLIAAGIAGAVVLFMVWLRQPGQRTRLDRALLAVPLAGATARKFSTSQLSRTLATLLTGGIPLVNAIEIASRAMGNRHLASEIQVVAQRVREGESLAVAMAGRGVFPDVAVKMIEVGEQTGALQDMLNSLADFYDEEIETNLGRFVTLIEPVLLVVMGLVIAGLLLALYMPVFNLSSVMGK